MDAFLKIGVDINGRVQDGYTALHLAAQEGHIEVVKLLVEKGADIDLESTERGRYAFYSACLQGHYDVANYLLPRVKNVNKRILSGVTPLNASCGKVSHIVLRC